MTLCDTAQSLKPLNHLSACAVQNVSQLPCPSCVTAAGLKYWSEHPTRHHDPTTVCDVVGHEGATDCETLKLYTEDWKWRRYRTVTNIR